MVPTHLHEVMDFHDGTYSIVWIHINAKFETQIVRQWQGIAANDN